MYVSAPIRMPWRGLGAISAPKILGSTASVAAAGAGLAATAAGLGAAAGPIGAGVGALVGIIAGLWSAHDARVAGATNENSAVSSAVQAFDAAMQAIFQYANSGQVTAAQAAQQVQSVYQTYWQEIAPYQTGPGTGDASHGGLNCPQLAAAQAKSNQCNSSCTVGCCVGCMDLYPGVQNALAVFANPSGGVASFPTVFGGPFGYAGRPGYSLTYTPPPAGSAAGVASAVTSGSVAGIPLWLILVGGLGVVWAATG